MRQFVVADQESWETMHEEETICACKNGRRSLGQLARTLPWTGRDYRSDAQAADLDRAKVSDSDRRDLLPIVPPYEVRSAAKPGADVGGVDHRR